MLHFYTDSLEIYMYAIILCVCNSFTIITWDSLNYMINAPLSALCPVRVAGACRRPSKWYLAIQLFASDAFYTRKSVWVTCQIYFILYQFAFSILRRFFSYCLLGLKSKCGNPMLSYYSMYSL